MIVSRLELRSTICHDLRGLQLQVLVVFLVFEPLYEEVVVCVPSTLPCVDIPFLIDPKISDTCKLPDDEMVKTSFLEMLEVVTNCCIISF